MKHAESEILAKAEKILSDLHGEYFNLKNIESAIYREKNEVARPRGEVLSTWTISIKESVFGSPDFLTISDETGEPLYYQNSHKVTKIEREPTGKYIYAE